MTLSTSLSDDENDDNLDDEEQQKYSDQAPSDMDHVIQEVYASTVTHLPTWVADDIQQAYIRNLCFVDTPGYGACLDVGIEIALWG